MKHQPYANLSLHHAGLPSLRLLVGRGRTEGGGGKRIRYSWYLLSSPLSLQPKLTSGSPSDGHTLMGSSSTGDTRGNLEPAFTQLSLSGHAIFEISYSEFFGSWC